jgi:hypothetical protein
MTSSMLKGKGPIGTLLAGAILAAVLFLANTNAVVHAAAAPTGKLQSNAASPTAGSPAPVGTPSATSSTAPFEVSKAAFAGHTNGRTASIAISIHNGIAIAYLCSGTIESWLQGTASGGVLDLRGTHRGTLTGTFTATGATGKAVTGGQTFTFTVKAVHKPSGLWRAVTTVRNAKVVAGWIVLPDGSQVGMVDTDGTETRAPNLDITTLTATVDGATLAPTAIDGETGEGF